MHMEPGLLAQPKLLLAAGAAAAVFMPFVPTLLKTPTLAVLWGIQRFGQSCSGALCFVQRPALSVGAV